MAACGSLQHMFEKPLPETPQTLLESFSSSSSLAEIFGELHFKENSHQPFPNIPSPFSSTVPIIDLNPQNSTFHENDDEKNKTPKIIKNSSSSSNNCHKKSASFSLNSESLQLCTEGLGFESSEDMKNEMNEDWQSKDKKITTNEKMLRRRRRATSLGAFPFPPPISCIGKSGKPWVSFMSYRQDGRFVLKEVRIPTQEFLHACREDGRLRLQFVQPNDEFLEEFDEDEEQGDDQVLVDDINIGEGKENRQA